MPTCLGIYIPGFSLCLPFDICAVNEKAEKKKHSKLKHLENTELPSSTPK